MMYIATYIIDIVALVYLIVLLYSSTSLNKKRKIPFLMGSILTIIIILAEAGTVFIGNDHLNSRFLSIIFNIIGFGLTPVIPIVLTLIFDRNFFNSHRFLLVPTIINIVAVILSPKYGLVFFVSLGNEYMRGDYFFIFITVYFTNFLLLVFSTLDMGNKSNYPIMKKMLILSVFTIFGTSIQLAYPQAYSSWHCITLALFLYFILLSEFDSSFDTLTGLYNRAAFDKFTNEITSQKSFSVIILDINDFKSINDTYGHDYGDKVIHEVANIIRKSFDKNYICYRFGGDEFSIIGNEIDENAIELNLKNMTTFLEEKRDEGMILPTVSYGYSIFRGKEVLDFYKLFKEADTQMYHYKKTYKELKSKI